MKEHPIRFKAEEVRATLDRRKTQFRRVIKPQPPVGYEPHIEGDFVGGRFLNGYAIWIAKNPYGEPGDRLWVQETWMPTFVPGEEGHDSIIYRADGVVRQVVHESEVWSMARAGKWRRNIHMPRWASRLTLEVVAVRVERVAEISDADVVAEGIDVGGKVPYPPDDHMNHDFDVDFEVAFRDVWDEIYAKRGYGWDENPWVWVVTFALVKGRK